MPVTDKRYTIVTVVGARPQFIKAAVLARTMAGDQAPLRQVLVHTGQHYDDAMSGQFFRELGLPTPDFELGVGQGTPTWQTGEILRGLEPIIQEVAPDAVLVVGDTTSTMAAALCATHLGLPLIHVEAGERIYKRHQVPEEVNRVLTDHLARLGLTATRQAARYLRREGIAKERIRFVGDLHYDLFCWGIEQREARQVTHESLGLKAGEFIFATIHRAENTDDPERLEGLLRTLDAAPLPVVMAAHPRVRQRLEGRRFEPAGALRMIEPLGYLDLIGMLEGCARCVTDSGGVSREAYFARKPSIVPMAGNYWMEPAWAGWSCCVGHDLGALADAMASFAPSGDYIEGLFGEGDAAEKIVEETYRLLGKPEPAAPWARHGETPAQETAPDRSGFTRAGYGKWLEELKLAGYRFTGYDEAEGLLDGHDPFVLLRHDVTRDLDSALYLAYIESQAGAQATYCFAAGSRHLNLLDPKQREKVRTITGLGHGMGLLIEADRYESGAQRAEACRREVSLLAEWFGLPVEVIAQKGGRPGDPALVLDGLDSPLPVADQAAFGEGMDCFTDAGGEWEPEAPWTSEAYEGRRPLHMQIDPFWYTERPVGAAERLERWTDEWLEAAGGEVGGQGKTDN